jgi:hypothetical protein
MCAPCIISTSSTTCALHAWQERGYRAADRLLCVSRTWQDILAREHGVRAALVSNGVDLQRYTARGAGPARRAAAPRLGLDRRAGVAGGGRGGTAQEHAGHPAAFLRLRASIRRRNW